MKMRSKYSDYLISNLDLSTQDKSRAKLKSQGISIEKQPKYGNLKLIYTHRSVLI
jgi:hypothetical protein